MPRVIDDRAKCDRRERSAECGQTHGRDRPVQRFGGNRKAMQVGRLALVRRHAIGGEALDMFDRVHALTHGEPHILGRHIVLEIDKRLDGCVGARARSRADHAADPVGSAGRDNRLGLASAGCESLVQCCLQAVCAIAGADRNAFLRIGARQEALVCRIPCDLAARLRKQMHRRRPAAGHDQRVDGDLAFAPPLVGWIDMDDTRRLPPALKTAWPVRTSIPSERASSTIGGCWIVARIDDHRHVDTGALQVDRRRIG